MGRNGDSEVGSATIGDGMSLTSGSLIALSSINGQMWEDGGSTISITGTPQKVDFAASSINNGMTSVNTSTDEITIPTTGLYEISYGLVCDVPATRLFYAQIFIGSLSTTTQRFTTYAGGTSTSTIVSHPMSKTGLIQLTSGDVISLRISGNTSYSAFVGSSILSIKRLR
jgi:hypothetical protein